MLCVFYYFRITFFQTTFIMATPAYLRKSANEKSIEELQKETVEWDKRIHVCTDEMLFLKQFLSANIFKKNPTDFYEKLNNFAIELEDSKTEKIDIQLAMRNHKNDLNGMLECEDISCDIFYLTQHQKIQKKLEDLLSKYQVLKLNIFRFTTPHFKDSE